MNNDEIDDAIATLKAEKARNAARATKGLEEDSIESPPKPKPKFIQKPPQKQKPAQNPQEKKPYMENTELLAEIERLKQEVGITAPIGEQYQPQLKPQPPWAKKSAQPAFLQPPIPEQTTKPNGQPRMSDTIEILKKLQGDKAFVTTAQKYGTALASSILAKTAGTPGRRLNFEDEAKTVIQLKGGSYSLIYKNGTPMRVAPYSWSLDMQTRRTWAVFMFNDFYGHINPPWWKFWKNVSKAIVLTPVSHTTNMADGYGKGYLTKFDEGTQFQQALSLTDDKKVEEMRSENKHFLSSALTLWMDLQSYTKPKINMKMILMIVAVAVVAIVGYYIFKTHPNLLSNILPHS